MAAQARSVAASKLAAAVGSTASAAGHGAPIEGQVGGTMYDHLKGDLVWFHDNAVTHFDDERLVNKKFYLLFFSAVWSSDGRKLTQQLLDYYNRISPEHPEFEVIFFSADQTRSAMENYMSEANMPWPAVEFDKLAGKAGAVQGNLVRQIPVLILADATGKILSSSNSEKDFGPDKVLANLDKLVSGSSGRATP
jgi:nucleoredoxin